MSEVVTESFSEMFEQSLANQRIRPGMILTGLVIDVGPDVVIVNVGLKSEAVIPLEQFKNERGEVEVSAGDQVEVALDSVEDGTGETRLSREKAKRARTWTRLEEAFNNAEIVTGIISGRVKGGFTVEIDHVRAFLPGSLVDVRPVRDTGYLEGKPLEFKVIKLDQKRNNVVVSRRAVVEQEFSAERSALMDNLQEGAVVRGTVKNLTDYGAFVDLGGIDGLLHITDMAWKRVKHPSEVVKVGDEVEVRILKFDRERSRVRHGALRRRGAPPHLPRTQAVPGKSVEGIRGELQPRRQSCRTDQVNHGLRYFHRPAGQHRRRRASLRYILGSPRRRGGAQLSERPAARGHGARNRSGTGAHFARHQTA